jgi:hypothetical protein
METLSGTTSGGNPPRGWNWGADATPIAIEPGGTDLTCVVTVASGGNVEWAPMNSAGAITGGWTTLTPGQTITINGGQRRALRPLSGSAACLFTCSGTGLDALAAYKGSKGSTISWG